jgi:hypothetical protein
MTIFVVRPFIPILTALRLATEALEVLVAVITKVLVAVITKVLVAVITKASAVITPK